MYTNSLPKPYEHLIHVWKEILSQESPDLSIEYAQVEDSIELEIRDEQKDTFDPSDRDFLIRSYNWLKLISPMHYTVRHKGNILLLISITPLIEGVAEISFLTDKNFVHADKIVKIQMIRAFRKALDALPFRRVQARVKSGFLIGTNFVEKLGFEQEGVLKQFGPELDDYIMYALLK